MPIVSIGILNSCQNSIVPLVFTCTTMSFRLQVNARNTNVSLYDAQRQSIFAYFLASLTSQLSLRIIPFANFLYISICSLLLKGNDIQKYFILAQLQAVQLNMSNQFHYLLKFIVVGDSGVGKSCVVLQFIEQRMNDNHQVTLGVEFASRTIAVKNKNIKFQVWDTAGQQNFRSITRSYYRSAIGALLVYDITKRKSFEHLVQWLREIRSNASSHLEVIVIGNKTDLQSQREVSSEQGRKFADQNQLQWIQLSAKDYGKVQAAFLKISNSIVSRIEKGEITQTTPGIKMCEDLQINPLSGKKKSCC